MKNFIITSGCLAVILFSIPADAQQYLQEATPIQEEKAEKIVEKFQDTLALTEKQELLFNNKQAEFIVAQELLINSNRPAKELNRLLLALYLEQAQEMKDILTRPQFDLYAKVRSTYDPLLVIL